MKKIFLSIIVLFCFYIGSAQNHFNNIGNCRVYNGATISFFGNFINSGTFITDSSSINFYGSTINGGGAHFNNVNINNTVTLGGGCDISGVLKLAATSTFNTTGQTCTLLSTASRTSSIAAIPTGSTIVGNITSQRFAPGGTTGWAFFGSPVSGNTVAAWDDDIYISCPSGCPDGAAGTFYSVQYYNETVASSYINGFIPVTTAYPLSKGKGYWVYLGDANATTGDITLDVTGPPNTGNVSLPVTYTSPNGGNIPGTQDGWNLVSNPYPSAINLNSASITRSRVDNTIYVMNADLLNGLGDYAYYTIGGSGSNMTNLLPQWQGFYVHANGINPSFSITENAKIAGNPTFMKTGDRMEENEIKLVLEGLGYTTDTYVRFKTEASNDFDGEFDVYKRFSESPLAPSICSKWNDTYYACNNLAIPPGDISIPIRVKVGTSGSYKISADSIEAVLPGSCILLYDNNNSTTTDLKKDSYVFTASDTADFPRFSLKIMNNCANVSLSEMGDENKVIVGNSSEGVFVQFGNKAPQNTIISAYNVIGQKVMDDLKVSAFNQKIYLDIISANQLILLSIQSTSGTINKKIFKGGSQ